MLHHSPLSYYSNQQHLQSVQKMHDALYVVVLSTVLGELLPSRCYIREGAESIGLIESINTGHHIVTLRRFMSWVELLDYIGDDVFANIFVWPDYVCSYPLYLCDTDVTMAIPVECIQGIAFVFTSTILF